MIKLVKILCKSFIIKIKLLKKFDKFLYSNVYQKHFFLIL